MADPDIAGTTRPPTAAAAVRPPAIARSVRAAAEDLYFNSWRIVPWNVLWGAGLLLTLWVWATIGGLAAVPVATALAVPTVALARLGGLATRGLAVHVSDGLEPLRARPVAVLACGLAVVLVTLVFTVNATTGLAMGGPLGWALATLAGWGLIGTVLVAVALWPLLADPERDARPATALVRVAVLLVIAHPVRLGALSAVVGAVLAIGTVLVAVLLTVAVGFAMLIACRFVLPAADRLEHRLDDRVSGQTTSLS